MTEKETYPVYLGLGTNLGDRKSNLEKALLFLDEAFGRPRTAVSDFIETEPWGFDSDDKFLNAAVRYDLEMPAGQTPADFGHDILRICKEIERRMGRTEAPEYADGQRIYKSRIIDIDILLIGNMAIDEPDLKVPHPLMLQREFVLKPLGQICPEFQQIGPKFT